jgi:hypothetical protein
MDVFDAQFLGQPGRDFFARPEATIGCGAVEGGIKVLAYIRRHERRLAGIVMAAVADSRRAVGIIAMQDFVDPDGGIGGHLGNRLDRVTLGVQQDDLPMRPFDGIVGRPVALLQVINRQVVGYL